MFLFNVTQTKTEVFIAKNRNGPTAAEVLKLEKTTTKFTLYDKD
jgi:replicative DNA helicase